MSASLHCSIDASVKGEEGVAVARVARRRVGIMNFIFDKMYFFVVGVGL